MKCKICGKKLTAHSNIFLTEYDELICDICCNSVKFKRCKTCNTIINADKSHCDECAKQVFRRVINSYTTKVTSVFVNRKGDNKDNIGDRYYGMEMEFSNTNPAITKVVFKDEYKNQHIYNKSDGSLRGNGVEIVTVPMTKNRLLDLLERMDFETFRKYHTYPDELSENAGVHIHVSKNTISPMAITRLSLLLNGIDSKKYRNVMYYLCGRTKRIQNKCSDNYYKIGTASYRVLKNSSFVCNHSVAFNLTNARTVEFRLFGGSSNKDELQSYVDIAHNMIEFAERNPLKNINIPNFITYLSLKTKSDLLKEKIKIISETKKECIGFRENSFKVEAFSKIIDGYNDDDKYKILNNLLYTHTNAIDYTRPITLDESKYIRKNNSCHRPNNRIQSLLDNLKKELVENILASA